MQTQTQTNNEANLLKILLLVSKRQCRAATRIATANDSPLGVSKKAMANDLDPASIFVTIKPVKQRKQSSKATMLQVVK